MRIIVFVFSLLHVSIVVCQPVIAPPLPANRPFILGRIDDIHSTILSENRTLNIYLPEGYTASDTTHYPVVYLLDGGADEDFIHVTGLYQFNNFSWIDRAPKSIIVGIVNTDRKRDFTFPTKIDADLKKYPTTGHSDQFIRFIENELIPYMDKTYHTNTSRTLIGQSLGGLFATEILLKRPHLFNNYIIISPSIWWDNGSILHWESPLLKKEFTQPTRVYIGVGKEGLTPGEFPRVMEVDANLLAEKIAKTESKSVNLHFDYLPDEDHATIMHQALYNALRILHAAH